jgi:beta-glucosidase-like glycosyl hydrolase
MRRAALLAALAFLSAVAQPCPAGQSIVDGLAGRGKLKIPLGDARKLESAVGQLLVINVDGFGVTGPLALSQGYADLVARIQPGGVIPHFGSTNFDRIVRTDAALAGLTTAPLLICSDIVKLSGTGGLSSFGDGYVGGFIGHYRGLTDEELATLARLNAFVFAALGINVALGPTVDTSTGDARVVEKARLVMVQMKRYGLSPVLKHYPTLPVTANLHHESPDTKLTAGALAAGVLPFHELAGEAGMLMTTHFRDSLVDPSLVTFSSTWNALLRKDTGFGGLLMSDGLLMLRNYTDRTVLAGGLPPAEMAGIDETAGWAARAILAGHDMVIVEGSAAQTVRVVEGLLALACAGTKDGAALAARITASSARVLAWKAANAAILRRAVTVPAAAVQAVMALLPKEGAALDRFRFDRAALARLEPALNAAALPAAGSRR